MNFATLERLEDRNLMAAPVVSDYSASRTLAALGEPITLTVTASSAAGMAAASFFVDINGNSGWDPGVDIGLGDVLVTGYPTQATLRKTVASTNQWPVPARVFANVVGRDREWMQRPIGLTIGRTAPPPSINFVSATQNTIAPGEQFQLSITATSPIPLRAATFFVDIDRNGRYGPGADIPLGDVWQPVSGTSTYRLNTTAGWDWGYGLGINNILQMNDTGVSIYGNVVDVNGTWGTRPVGTLMQLVPRANVTSFNATGTATTVQLTATASVSSTGAWYGPRIDQANGLRDMPYFYDANRNGRFDPSDSILGVLPIAAASSLTLNASTPASWPFPRHFGAFATDSRIQGNGVSDTRSAIILGDNSNLQNVLPTVASVGGSRIDRIPDPFVTAGNLVSLSAVVRPALGSSIGLATAIAFYDNDHNGRFDPSRDQLIEETPVSALGDTAQFNSFNITGAPGITGQVHVAVAAKDALGRIGNARSWIVLVGTPPEIQNISTTIITQGSSRFLRITIDANSGNLGIREINATIDPRSTSAFAPSSGTLQNGRWVLSINLSGLAPGVHDLFLRVSNIFRREVLTHINVSI